MKALQQKRQPAFLEWLFCIGFVVAGAVIMVLNMLPGSTPESELILLKGKLQDVKEVELKAKTGWVSILTCSLDKYHFEYTSLMRGYPTVRDAANAGTPVSAWVSTKMERAILREPGKVRLYKLDIGKDHILDYDTAVSESGGAHDNSLLIVGGALILIGIFGSYVNWKQLDNFRNG